MSSIAQVAGALPAGNASRSVLHEVPVAAATAVTAAPPAVMDVGGTRAVGSVALGLVLAAGLRGRRRHRDDSAQKSLTPRAHQADRSPEGGSPSPRSCKRAYFYQREAAALRAQGTSFRDFAREFYDFEDGPWDEPFIHASSAALCRKLQALGDRCVELVVDPGLMSRIDDFVAFVGRLSKDQRATCTPWKLRNLFSAHLGATTVWRVLTLTPDELKRIHCDGLLAHGLAAERKGRFRPRWANSSTTLIGRMTRTIEGDVDELMPVTRTPGVVYSSLELPPGRRLGKEIYLLKLRVPKLDLLTPRRCKDSLSQPSVLGYESNGDIVFYPPEMEQFLPFCGAPSEIVETRKVPRWAYLLRGALSFPRFAAQTLSYDARLFFG